MINFFKYSKNFLVLSFLLFIVSIFFISYKGFNYGIDFKGGTLVQFLYNKNISPENIQNLKEDFVKNDFKIFIQKFLSDDKRLLLKVSDNKTTQSSENFESIKDIIIKSMNNDTNIIFEKIEFIGSKTGDEFFFKASLAVIFALIGIFIYLNFRFNHKFALAGIICIIHDIVLSFGFISIFSIEFNLIFITAILTIIGYSINDSVIIFDRIRELLKTKNKDLDLKSLINLSLNNTLRRTIFTSLTTALACLALIFFAGYELFSFSIPVLFGIIIGTYSSIFIACQFILMLNIKNH